MGRTCRANQPMACARVKRLRTLFEVRLPPRQTLCLAQIGGARSVAGDHQRCAIRRRRRCAIMAPRRRLRLLATFSQGSEWESGEMKRIQSRRHVTPCTAGEYRSPARLGIPRDGARLPRAPPPSIARLSLHDSLPGTGRCSLAGPCQRRPVDEGRSLSAPPASTRSPDRAPHRTFHHALAPCRRAPLPLRTSN